MYNDVIQPLEGDSGIAKLPLASLDQEFWLPKWSRPSTDLWDERLGALLQGERWVIEGQYPRTLSRRARSAEWIVFLDKPRWLCLIRILRRMLGLDPSHRPPPGCRDHWDPELLRRVWTFRRTDIPIISAALKDFTGKFVAIRCAGEVDKFLSELEG